MINLLMINLFIDSCVAIVCKTVQFALLDLQFKIFLLYCFIYYIQFSPADFGS